MIKQVVIQKNCFSTQIAIIKDGEFCGFYMDTPFEADIQNKIIVGQVAQIVKSMNAVFVDFGSDKNGILHFKQIPDEMISKIKIGTRLPVQILKQNSGEKGHKLTAKVNLSGRFFVAMPFENGVNISKKIKDTNTRNMLKTFVNNYIDNKYGIIVRTNSQNSTELELENDIKELMQITDKFLATKDYFEKGTVLYEEAETYIQVVRDNIDSGDDLEVISDSIVINKALENDISKLYPNLDVKYKLCNEPEGIFSIYSIEKKRQQLFNRKIWLKNGGNLIIDYTEAMTVIDVNSAKAISGSSSNKNILELNLMAVKEAVLQILLRNLSGMIIIDLVEMYDDTHKYKVYEYAKEILKCYSDTRTKVYPLTELGLLQFSRTKKYQALPQQVYTECELCNLNYGKFNDFYLAILLEKMIKETCNRTNAKIVFVKTKPNFYEFLQKNKCILAFESEYNIKIELKKCIKTIKNDFEVGLIEDND